MRVPEPRPAELKLPRLEGAAEAWRALREQLNRAPFVVARRLVEDIARDLKADGWLRPPPSTED